MVALGGGWGLDPAGGAAAKGMRDGETVAHVAAAAGPMLHRRDGAKAGTAVARRDLALHDGWQRTDGDIAGV